MSVTVISTEFHKNPSRGSWLLPCGGKDGRTDGRTDRHVTQPQNGALTDGYSKLRQNRSLF